MRRLRSILKILGAGAIVLSALLCVTSLGMWIRSIYVADMFSLQTAQRFADNPLGLIENVSYSLSSDSGSVVVSRRRGTFGTPMPELQSLPRQEGELRWVWQTAPPGGGGRLRGFASE